ncbi:hypothetical protein FUSO7_05515 [Fusobacterium necrophorum BFTR-2]|nr:phage tail protein [Fusobacterium necrophorum]KDE73927.1 hypothetical protein FUSO7_05515 [Fusobacterium necrophorum BFTR-2]
MKFNGLTNEGKAYLAKIKTNHGTIEFKSMKFGDGSLLSYENPETFKKLKNQKSEKEILDKISNRDTITLNAVVDNTALRNGYYLREIGIFVSDQGREILFFYMNDGDETSFVPPETDGPYQAEIGINLVISNVESIVVNNESSDLYVTKAFVERKLKEKQDVIVWKSGGNLEKTNLTENDSNKLFTAKGALDLFNKLTSLISEKEPKILKKNGFNLSKSDADDLDSSTTLATSRAVKKVKDALNKINLSWNNISGKPNTFPPSSHTHDDRYEYRFSKNNAFNKNFGTSAGTVMEGSRYNEMFRAKNFVKTVWSGNYLAPHNNTSPLCTLPANWELCIISYRWGNIYNLSSNHFCSAVITKNMKDYIYHAPGSGEWGEARFWINGNNQFISQGANTEGGDCYILKVEYI